MRRERLGKRADRFARGRRDDPMGGMMWARRARRRGPGREPFGGGPFRAGQFGGGPFGRRGAWRRRGLWGLFGPFGPLGPFSPVWRTNVVKYVVAAGLARVTLDRMGRRLGKRRRGSRPWAELWDRGAGRGERRERREHRAQDRYEYEQFELDKERKMPRFGRGFPGFEGPRGRRFDRGDVKYVLMDLLREGPRHGYDMIKELEKRSGGFYSPSAGSIYPTLQMLEDQGLVSSTTVDGKRTYRLTDAGYAFIEERSERAHGARGRAWAEGENFRDDMRSVGHEAGDLARQLRDAVRSYTPDSRQIGEIRDVLGETRRRIEAILAERREAPRDEHHDKPTTV